MRRFLVCFGLAILVIAGGLSYLADSDPDGLEAATTQGCTVSSDAASPSGDCVARDAREHPLADLPLAGYAIHGRLGGVAGVLGACAVFGLAGGVFWLLRRPSS